MDLFSWVTVAAFALLALLGIRSRSGIRKAPEVQSKIKEAAKEETDRAISEAETEAETAKTEAEADHTQRAEEIKENGNRVKSGTLEDLATMANGEFGP